MKRTCKLAAAALLTAAVTVGTVTACAAAETAVTTETYAYLPDHSVYFYDVDDGYSWAFREVDTLAVAGVIQGRGDHLFYPRIAITRADFIVMLDRAYGMSSALESGAVTAQQDFSDVPSDKYYAKSVAAARALGVATGTADNRFLPQQTMSRQDEMVFLQRMESSAVARLLSLVPVLYGLTLFILFFLVYYANRFQLARRRHEFGVYLMLGMQRRKLFGMLLAEDLRSSLIALAIGLPAALLISEVLSLVTARLVGLGIVGHRFTLSLSAIGWTAVGFLAI